MWCSDVLKVLQTTAPNVNVCKHVLFCRSDGSFAINNLPSGSYVVEISHPNFLYEPARVDINSRGKMRARRVNYLQSAAVLQMSYPLKFRTKGQFKYFQVRETMKITDFLFNPMVCTTFISLTIYKRISVIEMLSSVRFSWWSCLCCSSWCCPRWWIPKIPKRKRWVCRRVYSLRPSCNGCDMVLNAEWFSTSGTHVPLQRKIFYTVPLC